MSEVNSLPLASGGLLREKSPGVETGRKEGQQATVFPVATTDMPRDALRHGGNMGGGGGGCGET